MNTPDSGPAQPLRDELAQAVERRALLLSHPAAAGYPDVEQAITDTQDQIDALTTDLIAAGGHDPATLSDTDTTPAPLPV